MSTINGTENADVLIGTASGDTIYGGAGNDEIHGGGGYTNNLYGEAGNDTYVFTPNGALQRDHIYEDPSSW